MAPPTMPPQTGVWSKLGLLSWKNLLLQTRHKFQTLLDIALPVLAFVLLAFLQKASKTTGFRLPTEFPSLEINTLDELWKSSSAYPPIKEHKLIFYPNNTIFDDLMQRVSADLKLENPIAVNEENKLESILVKNELIAAVNFHHSPTINEMPNDLSYSLRFPSELRTTELPSNNKPETYNWHTDNIFPTNDYNSPRNLYIDDGGPPSYHNEGFLAVQNAVARAFLSIAGNGKEAQMPEVLIKRFPYPAYTSNPYTELLQAILPLFVLLSFNYSFTNSVRFIAVEKEKQLKEAMKIMGLPIWLHWFSWFLRSMTMLTISVIFIIILLKVPVFGARTAVFANSNAFLLFIFFLTYCIALVTLSFLVSTFFSKAKAAVTASSIVWYLVYIPYFITHANYDKLAGSLKILLCIFPNTAMAYGIKLIIRNEEIGDGFNWSTMWRPINVYDSLTIGTTMAFLLLSSFVFMMLTVYIESIFPGSYGVAKPWYFPFKKEYWFSSQKRREYQSFDDHGEDHDSVGRQVDPGNFEEEPTDEYAGIVIKNLGKTFGKTEVVSNLSMNMFSNQITVIIGHNGAGKTTTFSMLTGMIGPTSGTALINGYDIRTNTEMARSSMGFCPQHNILFDELTVREHILFYSRLKGLTSAAASDEVEKYVRLLELETKINEISQNLSGGMKRKLSIGIALCGQSKVVICDEPTSGMDAASRRSLWNVLIEEKKDRTIVLTTHFMDEADVLGDRIGIMAEGGLQCFGSSFFLKKRFGTGYHLICEKNYDCNPDYVTGLLRKYLHTLKVASENESEISYLLPEDQVHLFPNMFVDLEENEQKLNLKSYGVSLTTMEEIFLKFGKDSVHADTNKPGSHNTVSEVISITENHFNDTVLLNGAALLFNQTLAMFKKRLLCWLRSWKIYVLYNIVAFIILAPTIFQGLTFLNSRTGLPPMDISLDGYNKPIAVVQENMNNSFESEFLKQYQQNVWTHSPNAKVVTTDNTLDSFLLNVANESLQTYNYQYVAAASTFSNGTILAWFNNQFYHTAPLSLNLVHNAILRTVINPGCSIHVVNEPLDFLIPANATQPDGSNLSLFGITLTFAVGIAMPLVSASYIMFYIQEKVCRAKFLQYVSGINLSLFWIASVLWDVLTNMVTVVLIVAMIAVSRQNFWSDANTLGVITTLFIMYNVAMMPIICLASLIFSKPTTGLNVVYFASMIITVVFACDMFMDFMPVVIRGLILMYPSCTLIDGLVKLSKTEDILATCENLCSTDNNCDIQAFCVDNPSCCPNLLFAWNATSVSKDVLIMLATSICSIIVLLLIEQGLFCRFISYLLNLRRRKLVPVNVEDEQIDDDVLAIKERVNAMTLSELQEPNLVMQNVSKFYGSFVAVNQVSIEIKQAECFGLLGNNGAGKTSIFKMLTGEAGISKGEIFIHGLNLKSDIRKIYKCIGYCPQFDALLENLTGREILEIFALIRGVPRNEASAYAARAATDLDVIEHVDKKVSQLSGGNKRKLSTAIALIGSPKVIFLDEPTTGMDPATKRNLWNIIIKLRDQGKSIVLTSHSMEECEALCTLLTIIVNGNCQCYGSSQHLKNKFTRGFELKIKVKHEIEGPRVTEVKGYIANAFSEAILTDEHQDLLTYTIPSRSLKWSAVFEMMENGKKTGNIDDYSVSQNSLEQVLLSFVKNQRARNEQVQETG